MFAVEILHQIPYEKNRRETRRRRRPRVLRKEQCTSGASGYCMQKKARREGARWAWETTANGGTDLWRYQPVKNMLQSVSASSVTTHACAFMERTKATGKIYSIKSGAGSKATLKELQRPCVFWPDKLHPVTLMRSTSRGIEGNAAAMRESSEYTDQFASAVVDAYFPS